MNEAIKEVLGLILLTRSQDRRLQTCIVTQVVCTPDLGLATVFWRTLGSEEERKEVAEALDHAVPFLRRAVQASLKMRSAPDFRFRFDEIPDAAARLDALLERLH